VPWKNKRKKRNAKKRVARKEQRSSAVLLIDEADALLGKRTKVEDAHDLLGIAGFLTN